MSDDAEKNALVVHHQPTLLPRPLNWLTLGLGNLVLRFLQGGEPPPTVEVPVLPPQPISTLPLPPLDTPRRFGGAAVNPNQLCIDFGTAACSVAAATPIGPEVAPLGMEDGAPRYVISSLFARKLVGENPFAKGKSTVLLGRAAYDFVSSEPREGFQYYRSLKRMISDLRRSKLSDHNVTENISDMILELIFMGLAPEQSSTFQQQASDLKKPLEAHVRPFGLSRVLPCSRITAAHPLTLFMTVPNAFGEFECSLIRKAGESALNAFHKWLWAQREAPEEPPASEIRMLREADAVAWWELSREPSGAAIDERWMIFDVGGGSTDVTVVSVRQGKNNPSVQQLCHSGVTFGGNDVDELILTATAMRAMGDKANRTLLGGFLKEQDLDRPRHDILSIFRHRKEKDWSSHVEDTLRGLAALPERPSSRGVDEKTRAEQRQRLASLQQLYREIEAGADDVTEDVRYAHFFKSLTRLHVEVMTSQRPGQSLSDPDVGLMLQQLRVTLNAPQLGTADRKYQQRDQWQAWIRWLADGAHPRDKPDLDTLDDMLGIRPYAMDIGEHFWNRPRIGNTAANYFSEFSDEYGLFLRAIVCGVVDDILQFGVVGPERKLDRVIISGRAARLPGITELLTRYLVHNVKLIPDPDEIRRRAKGADAIERAEALAQRTIGPVRPDPLVVGRDRDRMKLACVRGTAIAAGSAIQGMRLGDTVSEDISYKIGNEHIPLWTRGSRLLARAEAQALIELPKRTFDAGQRLLKFQQHRFPQKIAQIFPEPRYQWQFRPIRSIAVPADAQQYLKVHFDHGEWTLKCWELLEIDEDHFEASPFPGDDDGPPVPQINPVTQLSFGWADEEQS